MKMGPARLVKSIFVESVETTKQLVGNAMLVLVFIKGLHACHVILQIYVYNALQVMSMYVQNAK